VVIDSIKASARDLVHATLRQQIISCQLTPGSPLSEKEIAAELGVSRTPVREAIILLVEEGLVQVFPQLGTFVTRIALDRVSDSQFVREALESASLGEAFERVTPDDVQGLHALLDEQDAAISRLDHTAFFELDDAFHRQIMVIAGRESVWRQVSAAKGHMDRARRLSLPLPNVFARLLREHRLIAESLGVRDQEAGIDTLRTHLRGVFTDFNEIQSLKPEYFAETKNDRPVRRLITTLVSSPE
jgi:DNA-binding GntR family transcriptional regulator